MLEGITAVDPVQDSSVTVWWGIAWRTVQFKSPTAAHRYRKGLIDALKAVDK